MWYKLFILLIYFLFLFALARVLELIAWCDSGLWHYKIMNPMSLSITRLKSVLETRGVSYHGEVEKKDIAELVEATGVATGEEVLQAVHVDNIEVPVTNFTHGLHFSDEVEDKKDSVWLIQVSTNHWPSLPLSYSQWLNVRKKLSKFGVRHGIFDCNFDYRMCQSKGWTTPRLVLALPHGDKIKANVSLITFTGRTQDRYVVEWVRNQMNRRVDEITNFDRLKEKWLGYKKSDNSNEIRVIFFAKLAVLPLIFSALSFKFPGRVKFALVNKKLVEQTIDVVSLSNKGLSPYMVVTKQQKCLYGLRSGELFSFKRMEFFLKTLYPEINDLFIVALFLSNCLAWVEMAIYRGGVIPRTLRLFWFLIKYNVIVILTALPTIALFQFSYISYIASIGLSCFQYIGMSNLASLLRKDLYLFINKPILFLIGSGIYLIIIACIEAIRRRNEPLPDWHSLDFSNFTAVSHLVGPFYNLSPFGLSVYPNDSPSIELIGHGVTNSPTWLQHIDRGYIKDLPRWCFEQRVFSKVTEPVRKSNQTLNTSYNNDEYHDHSISHVKSAGMSFNTFSTSEHAQFTNGDKIPTQSPSGLSSQLNGQCHGSTNVLPCHTKCSIRDKCSIREHTTTKLFSIEKAEDRPNGRDDNSIQSQTPAMSGTTTQAVFPKGFLVNRSCVICLDLYVVNDTLCGLPCGHSFHDSCINTWLSADHHFCPVCRWPSYQPKMYSTHLHSE